MTPEDLSGLQAKPWLQSRFSFGHFNRRQALRTVFRALRAHNAQPEDILTLFSPAVRWPVPARYSTHLPFNRLLPRVTTELSVRQLATLFEDACPLVAKHGYSGPAADLLVEAFGPQAVHPMIFTTTAASEFAVKLFSAEYALALSDRNGVLVVEGNNCFMRLRGTKNISLPVGLYNRKSIKKPPDWLRHLLYEPRGYVNYGTFDTVDRCLLWGQKNLIGYEKIDFDMALMSIKGQKIANLTTQFEQFIYKMEMPFEDSEDEFFTAPFAELLYTDEAYEQIRFIWYTGDCPTYDHYKELYSYLVPTYFSTKQFETLFHVGKVSKLNFTYEHVGTIDSRFEEFTAFFKRLIRSKL